ncbi:MAG: SOS response-associated peptidase [Pseudomonadota bacterium]
MPGRLFLETPVAEVAAALGAEIWPEDEPPRRNIQPGQEVLSFQGGSLRLMRWGMIPVGRVNARGRPVMETIINARSETVFEKSAFSGVGRAVLPADGWYEWTGEKRRKQPWRLRAKDGGLIYFAAITDTWRVPGGASVAQIATVTCEPNEEVRPIHHRMGVILSAHEVPFWLEGEEAAARKLMRPAPDGGIQIEKASDVDWERP